MASIVFREHNRRKNRVSSEKRFRFENFVLPNSVKTALSRAFRDNIRFFLQNFAEIEDYTVNGMSVWSSLIVSETEGVFPLYTIEETVESSGDCPFCNHCKLSGWGHHFVCKRKYHLVIPAKEHWGEPLNEDFQEIEYHNLYGLIHCNGYGHLIRINGFTNSSRFFSADDSMEFWDRFCTFLKARSISAFHSEAFEPRLIHGLAYGKSWLGKWGYRFSHGRGPEITEQKYNAAIKYLSSLSIEKIITQFKNKENRRRIRDMIEKYRKFSGRPPVTLSDLLKLMLVFESRSRIDTSNAYNFESETEGCPKKFQTLVDITTRDCRWSAKRLEDVLFLIVDLLKEQKADNAERECGMSRQELRDKARKTIGDTGLIDFVLKSIKCFVLNNQIIRRATNPLSRLAEFTIHEISPGTGIGLGFNLFQDVMFLYEYVLLRYSETEIVMCSAFLKDWPIEGGVENQSMKLICKVLPSFDELETELTRKLSPGEVVVVDPQITIGNLRMVAQHALRDTYHIMDQFEVTQIGGLRKIEDNKVLESTVEPGSQVWVRGSGLDLATFVRYGDGSKKARAW